VALVIGNGAYANTPLKNPVNDARDVAQALRELGFEVIHKENVNQNDMKRAIRAFGESGRAAGVRLFYYAGHGVQVNGENYLVPVGADFSNEQEVEYESVNLGLVLAQMEEVKNSINLVVLDACRNNPFARNFRSATRGLAPVDALTGTFIAYATAPGSVASDGSERNGLYTQELLRYLRVPGVSVEEVFKRVRISVREKTQGKQIPWESSSLTGDFYFIGGKDAAQQAVKEQVLPPVGVSPAELSFWESVKNSTDPEDFSAYLKQYPSGSFVSLARSRMQVLQETAHPNAASNAGAEEQVKTVDIRSLSFSLQECRIAGTAVKCKLTITNNRREAREIVFHPDKSTLVDDQSGTSQMAREGRDVEIAPPGISINVTKTFQGVATNATSIRLLSIAVQDIPTSHKGIFSGTYKVEFSPVTLQR
jgi:hypothetical protein